MYNSLLHVFKIKEFFSTHQAVRKDTIVLAMEMSYALIYISLIM